MSKKILLFDLDGTLLKSDKTISEDTMNAVMTCKEKGYLIGVVTSRSEQNTYAFLKELQPDILITSGGALVKKQGEYLYKATFSVQETNAMIRAARKVCGEACEITIDTLDAHYWNYKTNPKDTDRTWGDSIWTDYHDLAQESLKMCVEIFDERQAECLKTMLPDCDMLRFSDGYWYKFTKKNVTKENAIEKVCEAIGITNAEIIAFGDDYADIGMLNMAGIGVAMGNAIDAVKEVADIVIGTNDNDGIADYLKSLISDASPMRSEKYNIDKLAGIRYNCGIQSRQAWW